MTLRLPCLLTDYFIKTEFELLFAFVFLRAIFQIGLAVADTNYTLYICCNIMDTFDRNSIRLELLAASKQLSNRGLHHAAKWAAELLISVLNAPADDSSQSIELDKQLIDEIDHEEPYYLLAKSYFDLKEYYRASNALVDCNNAKCVFLRGYSRYLVSCLSASVKQPDLNVSFIAWRETKRRRKSRIRRYAIALISCILKTLTRIDVRQASVQSRVEGAQR